MADKGVTTALRIAMLVVGAILLAGSVIAAEVMAGEQMGFWLTGILGAWMILGAMDD